MRVSIRSAVNRRRLLTTSASAATLTAVSTIARPYLSFAADRPAITHGVLERAWRQGHDRSRRDGHKVKGADGVCSC